MAATLLVPALAAVLVDQLTKALARERGVVNARGAIVALAPRRAVALWIAAVASVALVVAAGPPLPGAGAAGLGLALGGATANLADRLTRGGVVDFIALGRWPAFNVADAALTAGAALAIWSVL